MRQDGDLIVDAGDVTSAVRAIGMVWRDAELDRLAPDTLERAARLLHAGAGGARALAERLDRRAIYMRDHHPKEQAPCPNSNTPKHP